MHGMRMWLVTAEGEAWPVSVSVLVMTASPAVDRKLIGHWTTAISIGRSEKMYFLYQFISFFG